MRIKKSHLFAICALALLSSMCSMYLFTVDIKTTENTSAIESLEVHEEQVLPDVLIVNRLIKKAKEMIQHGVILI